MHEPGALGQSRQAPLERDELASLERIAVFRALQLGDLLCAVPALRALRAAAPRARITLIGLPWAREFVRRFARYVDELVEFPGWPALPERALDAAAVPAFLADMQARRFDLAIQLHGSGGHVNDLVALLGARRTAGFFEPGRWCPDPQRFVAWPEGEHEIRRYLLLMERLGAPSQGTALEFPLTVADHLGLSRALRDAQGRAGGAGGGAAGGAARTLAGALCGLHDLPLAATPGSSAARPMPRVPVAVVHPGSQLPSRRWPPQRFAQVADALAARGLAVILTGTAAEAPLTAAVAAAMRAPAIDLAGRTTLGAVAALISRAQVLICNDTGVSHIAAALATPSVVVCSGADAARWAPLDAARHRVLAHPAPCRPCAHPVCPIEGHPCSTGTSVEAVIAQAAALLAADDGPTGASTEIVSAPDSSSTEVVSVPNSSKIVSVPNFSDSPNLRPPACAA